MNPGQRVAHPAFGSGTITKVILTGSRQLAEVDFGYTRASVNPEFLQLLPTDDGVAADSRPTNAAPPPPDEAKVEEHPLPAEETDPRKGVTALRLGQVLEAQILQ